MRQQTLKSVIDSGIDSWYWGNILFGGFLGMLILDPATGAMYKLPDSTSTGLSPTPITAAKTAKQATVLGATKQSKEELLNELASDKNLSYEEYQRRYQAIMLQ